MTNSIAKTHADGHASVEEVIGERAKAYRARLRKLLGSTEGRLPGLWSRAEADISMTHTALQAVPVAQRDTSWLLSFSAIISAAQWQAWLETFGDEMLRKTAKYGAKTQSIAKDMSLDELKVVAKEGFTKGDFDGAKAARKQRTVTNGSK